MSVIENCSKVGFAHYEECYIHQRCFSAIGVPQTLVTLGPYTYY